MLSPKVEVFISWKRTQVKVDMSVSRKEILKCPAGEFMLRAVDVSLQKGIRS
jgi:hypothetical protein